MAELCINLESKIIQDDLQNIAKSYQRGHVIAIMDDGYKWNDNERTGQFMIVSVPGVPKEELQVYLDSPTPIDIEKADPFDPTVQSRAILFDVDEYIKQPEKQQTKTEALSYAKIPPDLVANAVIDFVADLNP